MVKLNNKGVSLLELLAAIVILGIICMTGTAFMRVFNAQIAKGVKKGETTVTNLNNATAAANQVITMQQALALVEQSKTKWFYVDVPTLGQCKKADAQYWIARTAARVVTLYTNSNCTSSIGTLNATDNSRFTNKNTKTLWEVSGDTATLTVQLIVFP